MAKNSRPATARKSSRFDIESNRWLVPIVFLFMFLALVVLFSDFIFSDQMLRGSDTLQTGYMFRQFYVDYFNAHGAVPQWIPYYFGGMPYVEAFHGDIFYPLTFLKFFGSLERMLGWFLFFHIFLAGICMYFCARQFKMSKIPALVAGAGYMFAAYLVSMAAPGHDGKMYVTALFPLMMLFLDRGFERKPFLNFSILGGVIGLILLTPHPQMSYFSLWALSLYSAFKLIVLLREKKSIVPLILPASLTTYAVVIGLLISAIQFYPGYMYTTNDGPRSESKRGWEWATSWSLHEEEVASLIIPEFAGTTSHTAETYYWGKNVFKDNAETVAPVVFFAALLGFLFYRRKESYFFAGLALLALIYGLGATTPIFKLFFLLIPNVASMRAPSMIMFLFSFSAAMLAAMGLQWVINQRKAQPTTIDKKFTYVLFGWPALMLLLAVLFSVAGKGMLDAWCSIFYSDAPTTMIQQNFSKLDLAYMNLPAIKAGAWLTFLFTAVAAACIWLYRTGKAGVTVLLAIVVIVAVNGVRFDGRFLSLVDSREFQSRFGDSPVADYFLERGEKFRVLDLTAVNDNSLAHRGVDVVVGYHGNQLKTYDVLLGGKELTNVYRMNPRMLNLVGAKYILFPAGRGMPPDYFGEKPFTAVANIGQKSLFRNDNALPRVFLVDQCRKFDSDSAVVNEILNGSSDMRHIAYLTENPTMELQPDSAMSDTAWIANYDIDSVRVGVNVTGNKILVLTDNYYQAWQVKVDGVPAKLLRVYNTFRGVEVPAGTREVTFEYHSQRYTTARTVTWVTVLYLLGILGYQFMGDRRRKRNDEQTKEKETQE